MRIFAAIALTLALALLAGAHCVASENESIGSGLLASHEGLDLISCDPSECNIWRQNSGEESVGGSTAVGSSDAADLDWLPDVKVGYDRGFVIASRRELELESKSFPYRLQINGWGQIRYTVSDMAPPNTDLNQLGFNRARLVFSGHALSPDFSYFVQLDGGSGNGDSLRFLDYYFRYDIGHDQLGLDPGAIALRAGRYKMPFTMSRWLSGKELEFSDRSVASLFFDVNRSLACGLDGQISRLPIPVHWEAAVFNGFDTGGTPTGNAGAIDENLAYSIRLSGFPIGDWGTGELADFDGHDQLALRFGCAFAATTVDRSGTSEFNNTRVADSGVRLASLLPAAVDQYDVSQFAIDASAKLYGWSSTLEYYFRNISDFRGAAVPDLFDHGFWLQQGYFIVPSKLQLLGRWSHVIGDSGSLGATQQSANELAAGVAWYFRGNSAKLVSDVTHLDGAPINSSALNIAPGDSGWLYRTQFQISF